MIKHTIRTVTDAFRAARRAPAAIGELQAADDCLRQGDAEAARQIYAKLEAEFSNAPQRRKWIAAKAARKLGALEAKRDIPTALSAYQRAAALEPNDAGLWSRIGHLSGRAGNYVEARRAFEMMLEIARARGAVSSQAAAKAGIGDALYCSAALSGSDKDVARPMLDDARRLYQSAQSAYGVAYCQSRIGLIDLSLGNLDDAERGFREALEYFESEPHFGSIADQHLHLGMLEEKRGRHETAREHFHRSAKLSREHGYLSGAADAECRLGASERKHGDPKRARAALQTALDEATHSGSSGVRAAALIEMSALDQDKDINAALKLCAEAAQIFEETGNTAYSEKLRKHVEKLRNKHGGAFADD